MTQPTGLKGQLVEETINMVSAGEGEPSLRELAKRLGVSAMALYRHFPNKAALLEAVIQAGFEMLRAELEKADTSAENEAALVAQGMAYVNFATTRPQLFRLMFGGENSVQAQLPAREGAYIVMMQRIERASRSPVPGAALACWAVVHGLAILQIDRQRGLQNQEIQQALEIVVRGALRGSAPPEGQ
ncbi:TetR/AcrR family transcriptional regulator [Altererythrobacter sp. CC-YST694]|uniref:TetR/AcrR family transcriptional regulator n=1 Tax=Altererythrobacter sp. CC-YST694 TaxID=2755038 RepID=UPI001D031D32|nr:TetR/AcrR family transcriptional regulator [Altererythrobacter sp. CC-YST694]MCB5426151.1 TetR/AcrR family transcriptional regulator [Altererythrobacter sp. CC-YST694]